MNALPEFASRVRPLLERDETTNGLFLGLLARLSEIPPNRPPFLFAADEGNEPVLAAAYEARNLVISPGPKTALVGLAQALRDEKVDPPGAIGPADQVAAFSEVWTAARPCRATTAVHQGLLQLDSLIEPVAPMGQGRLVLPSEVDLLAEWLYGFQVESLPFQPADREASRVEARTRVKNASTYVWEVEGRAVATASLARPTTHTITVNAVYTPLAMRGHGFATAVVAAASREGLRRRRSCILYTDLSNATSNGIYLKLGYRRVGDSRCDRFEY